MSAPSVSIIIPTHNRPQYLARAIRSALASADGGIEVIVIPNGRDMSWKSVASEFSRDCRVRWEPIERANVSAARNHGLEISSGQIIRFLDDDDFLIPAVARLQHRELLENQCDLSTYAARIEDQSGHTHQIIAPVQSLDYGVAVLGPNCPALTFASAYKAESIRNARWNESYRHTEDEDWMRRLAQDKEIVWFKSDKVVGVWYQHREPRLSKPIPTPNYYRNRATSILETIEVLNSQDRLTPLRRSSAADGLWSAVHGGFFFSPLHWSRVATQALSLAPTSRPSDPFFKWLPPSVSPLLLEWLMLPKRWINHLWRLARGRVFGWPKVRKI